VAGFLSHGAQKQLELGLALALEPEILLLDEPTAGMSATETREAIRLIERIARERGLTLLFTEHDMEVVFSIAEKITVLHQGRVIADGTPAEVRPRRVRPPRLSRRAPLMATTSTPILEVEDVHTAYGLSRVLFGVSLLGGARRVRVSCSAATASARRTTMRSIMGLTPPSSGRIVWKGRDITREAPFRTAALGIGFVPEDRRIFADLTVWENLDVAAARVRPGGFTTERVFDLFPGAPAAQRSRRRLSVRRRAADAHDRAHPDGQPRSCSCSTSRRRAWRR
jgi:branched-chain amino acid transport system ATP-binding protein